jgi:hypothetical protein
MRLSTRRWVIAAVAIVGASLITATPVVAAPPDVLPDVQAAEVQLTAGGFDDVSLADLFTNASNSFTHNILDPLMGAPSPTAQQLIVNLLTGNPTDFNAAFKAPFEPFYPFGGEPYLLPSLSNTPITAGFYVQACGEDGLDFLGCLGLYPSITLGGHSDMLNWLIHGFPLVLDLGTIHTPWPLPDIPLGSINFGTIDILNLLVLGNNDLENAIRPFLELMGSPASGVAWGSFGTFFSPIFQTLDDTIHIFDALKAGDPTTAFNDLLDMPINSTNAFFEGYGNAYNLLEEMGIGPILGTTPEVDLGGLFSPAGSIFNAFGFDFHVGASLDLDIVNLSAGAYLTNPATMVGPIASMLEVDQAIAQAIGWDDVGNQLANLASLF